MIKLFMTNFLKIPNVLKRSAPFCFPSYRKGGVSALFALYGASINHKYKKGKTIKKKTPLIVTSLAALACVFSLNAFAAMPSGSHQWKGDVDFWVSKFGTATKKTTKIRQHIV